ncbi:MAG: DUF4919 domain-containing protein [Rikenellaceae bacterium]|nr:DUF4919 domain-containing protein [Rikenellaceae bacterium]
MKRFLITALSLFVVASAIGATPNNDRIFANINDVDSPFYYPNLILRYKEGKPMSKEEYHHLYYGYAFQPSYKPLEVNSAMARVQEVMARISIDKPSIHDIDELIAAGLAAMEHDPFSPTLLNILVYAYGASGDRVRELAYSDHLNGILRCIEESGDGLKEKSPMHIIMFSHGLDYIASKNINYLKGRIISRTVEFVPFDFPKDKVKGFYFDYSRIYWNKPENYTFKRERTWQFNNLKPREYK